MMFQEMLQHVVQGKAAVRKDWKDVNCAIVCMPDTECHIGDSRLSDSCYQLMSSSNILCLFTDRYLARIHEYG